MDQTLIRQVQQAVIDKTNGFELGGCLKVNSAVRPFPKPFFPEVLKDPEIPITEQYKAVSIRGEGRIGNPAALPFVTRSKLQFLCCNIGSHRIRDTVDMGDAIEGVGLVFRDDIEPTPVMEKGLSIKTLV
jgi:hypothetical protein